MGDARTQSDRTQSLPHGIETGNFFPFTFQSFHWNFFLLVFSQLQLIFAWFTVLCCKVFLLFSVSRPRSLPLDEWSLLPPTVSSYLFAWNDSLKSYSKLSLLQKPRSSLPNRPPSPRTPLPSSNFAHCTSLPPVSMTSSSLTVPLSLSPSPRETSDGSRPSETQWEHELLFIICSQY